MLPLLRRITPLASVVLLTTAPSPAGTIAHFGHAARTAGASSAPSRYAARTGGLLFVSNFYAKDVLVFRAGQNNPPVLRTISQGLSNSYNLTVDQAGTLYVQGNNNTITEFPHGGENPNKVLNEPQIGYGTCVTLAVGTDGTVYSADLLESQLYEFANGATSPTTTIDVPHPFGIALDSKNDLYVGYTTSSSGFNFRVMKFAPGSTQGKDLGIQVSLAGGINIDKHNNLLVGDQGNQTVYIYKPGKKTAFRTISTAPYYPYQFSFDRNERRLYLVSGTPAAIYVYDYRSGKLDWTDNQGLSQSGYAEGVAVSPAPLP